MNRREFLMRSSAAAVAAGSGVLVAPKAANAEPVTLATVSAAFNLASGIAGFLSRDANPTVPWLISLGEAVDALNIKIDAIDRKLDLMLAELFEIRQLVEKLPYENQLLGLGIAMREPYAAFLELKPETQSESPSEAYLRAIPKIRDRMRTTRIRYLDLARQERAPAFEAVLQLALAQDAELILAAEMQRPEMYALGLEEDIKGTLGALEAYASFFDAAFDSMKGVKFNLALDVWKRLETKVHVNGSVLTAQDIFESEVSVRLNRDLTECTFPGRIIKYIGHPKRNKYKSIYSGADLEDLAPILVNYYLHTVTGYYTLNVERTIIPNDNVNVSDIFNYPYLHEMSSVFHKLDTKVSIATKSYHSSGFNRYTCTNKPIKGVLYEHRYDILERLASDVNAAVARYYKLHYAHGVCALAQTINARQQRILRGLL